MPLPAALGYYMGLRHVLDPMFSNGLQQKLDSEVFLKHFTCASQDRDTMRKGYVLADGASSVQPMVRMSYIFNGTVLGRRIAPWGETPAGKLSRIRRPSIVLLFADGNAEASGSMWGYCVEAAYSTREVLMYNFLFIRSQFDHERHRGKMNVVFVDGHGETVQMPNPTRYGDDPYHPGDFERIGTSLGIFD